MGNEVRPRLDITSNRYVESQARQAGISKNKVVEAIVAEAARRGWRIGRTLAVHPREGDDE